MPRALRVFADGAVYHLSGRLARGEPLFADDAEAGELLEILRGLKDRDELEVYAWCIVGDRYHLALRTSAVPLWRTMRLLQGRFARLHNRRHGTSGPLWNGRYAATLIEDEDLGIVMAAVHVTPVVAGLVDEPGAYRWSGHRGITGETDDPLIEGDSVLAVFGESLPSARSAYLLAIGELAATAAARGSQAGLAAWRPERLVSSRRRTPGATPARPSLTASDLLELAAPAIGTTEVELRSVRRGSGLTRLRGMIALVGVEQFGVRVKELAAELGRDPASVSRWINACGDRRARDPVFRRSLRELAASVTAAARAAESARSGFVFESGAP